MWSFPKVGKDGIKWIEEEQAREKDIKRAAKDEQAAGQHAFLSKSCTYHFSLS